MIYTDGVHLISTRDTAELHAFAIQIGLKREWFQDHPKHPHYDLLSMQIRKRAFRHGAKRVDRKALSTIIKKAAKEKERPLP